MVFFFDDIALTVICQKTLRIDEPKMTNLHNIVALCMSGIKCRLRSTGIVDADQRKMHTNWLPFKNAHLVCLIGVLTPSADRLLYTTPSLPALAIRWLWDHLDESSSRSHYLVRCRCTAAR